MIRCAAQVALGLLLLGACAPPVLDASRSSSHGSSPIECPDGAPQTMSFGTSYITAAVIRCQVSPTFDSSAGLLAIDTDGTMSIQGRPIGRWPGGTAARRRPQTGEEVQPLEEAVKTIVDMRFHGAPAEASVKVHFRERGRGPLGDALVFDVAMSGTQSDAGMCHQWTSEAHATGELVLRASDGSLLWLGLRGPMSDTEALCPEGANEKGRSAEPTTCNRGEMIFLLTSRCYHMQPLSAATAAFTPRRMLRRSPRRVVRHDPDALFAPRKHAKKIPFDFVLDEIAALEPHTRPMFGCTAVYIEDKIVFVLRDKPSAPGDNGVWMATTREHHASLRPELPCMRSIAVLGSGVTGWQVLPAEADDFETCVLHACALVCARDERIGKVPTPRRRRSLAGRKRPR